MGLEKCKLIYALNVYAHKKSGIKKKIVDVPECEYIYTYSKETNYCKPLDRLQFIRIAWITALYIWNIK